jgi:hypothetical protein
MNSGNHPTSGNVNSIVHKSDMAENTRVEAWNRGAISHRSKVISTSGLMAAISNFGI